MLFLLFSEYSTFWYNQSIHTTHTTFLRIRCQRGNVIFTRTWVEVVSIRVSVVQFNIFFWKGGPESAKYSTHHVEEEGWAIDQKSMGKIVWWLIEYPTSTQIWIMRNFLPDVFKTMGKQWSLNSWWYNRITRYLTLWSWFLIGRKTLVATGENFARGQEKMLFCLPVVTSNIAYFAVGEKCSLDLYLNL